MSLMNEGTRKWCRASNSLLWIARVEAYYESPPGGRGTQARSISVSSEANNGVGKIHFIAWMKKLKAL